MRIFVATNFVPAIIKAGIEIETLELPKKSGWMHKKLLILFFFIISLVGNTQDYPRNYFRHPLNVPMQLVANFGEIRANHWHMGLDIRTQQRENLQVYAAAEGYVSRIVVEPGGFGQAIYIDHPNGFTTLYAHMNAFFPALQKHVLEEQYRKESWRVNLSFTPNQFPLQKGDYIGLSGNTGGSAGPHVHFEIRDTKTEKVLNPLLFGFPIPDAVPPSVVRLAMYDRNRSTYLQSPQLLNIQRTRNNTIKVGSNKVSFAVGATDRFSGSNNPNGIYAAKIYVDEQPVSSFTLDNIGYDETRYINAQIDYPYEARGGASLQHITPLPGARNVAYDTYGGDGTIQLTDNEPHAVLIEVYDANKNVTRIPFRIQYEGSLAAASNNTTGEQFLPDQINIFERENFQLVTTERTMYDVANVSFNTTGNGAANAVSPLYGFLSSAIPSHDSVTVRIKPSETIPDEWKNKIVIRSVSGSRTSVQKAVWQKGWLMARFRQFGTYQAFIDNVPPNVNGVASNLSKATRIVLTPTDNFNTIKSFRAEVDGQWLRFTNDKGRTWIYKFDEMFPRGEHQLKVRVEDEAGNVTERTWNVVR
ncbi:MAG TPA: M23 family metallopeptidase [Flavisolibacter sp.]|nr:M23 family metallopeptidase [Flavisolibacter sp.]